MWRRSPGFALRAPSAFQPIGVPFTLAETIEGNEFSPRSSSKIEKAARTASPGSSSSLETTSRLRPGMASKPSGPTAVARICRNFGLVGFETS